MGILHNRVFCASGLDFLTTGTLAGGGGGVLPVPSMSAVIKVLHVRSLSLSCVQLCVTVDVAYHVPLFMGFSRQEYWSGLPFPSPY